MTRHRKKITLFLAGLTLTVAVLLIGYIVFHKSHPTKSPNNSSSITINDNSAGLSFNMSKNFEAIPKNALAFFNKDVLYGFQVPKDKNAQCVISQTKIDTPGMITSEYLRDETFKTIKSNHPNASLDNAAVVKVGTGSGVLLEISYVDGVMSIKRVEIAAVGTTNITFAYCQSLAADNPQYKNDFTIFFSSLKLSQ